MSDYKSRYYAYQTTARGLVDEAALQSRFARQARWYARRLKRYLPSDRTARCLDLPCGYGNFLFFLRAQGYRNVHGVDADPEQVRLARLLGLPAETGDAFAVLAAGDARYQMISSLDFLEHLDKDSAMSFLEKCYAGLSPGGTLLMRMPCADGPFGAHDAWNDITHQWGMSSTVIRTLLELNGFESIHILDERPMPTGGLGLLRWLAFFPARAMASLCCAALGIRPPKIWSRSMLAIARKPV